MYNLLFPAGLIFILIISLLPPISCGGVTSKIDPDLKRKIDSAPAGSTWDVIIGFKKDPNLLDTIEASVSNIEERHLKTYNSVLKMQQHSEECQGSVITSLKKFKELKEITTLWISNDLFLRSAGKEVIYMLGDDEKPENENITVIEEDEGFPLQAGVNVDLDLSGGKGKRATPKSLLEAAWGIQNINAPAWWDAGYNGSGVIIGHIDTGVDVRHPSLKWNWVGKGPGWFDPRSMTPKTPTNPYEDDINFHGTHSLGVAVGRGRGPSDARKESDVDFFGVGVAPGARWISCLGCRNHGEEKGILCDRSDILKCGAFMICPTMDEKCRYRPNVVMNTYGCNQNSTHKCPNTISLVPMIESWHKHGIIPVFVAGNNGDEGCSTVNDVGDYADVITVGSVDKYDKLTPSSSLGPPEWRYVLHDSITKQIYKPDIVAPGERVLSTSYSMTEGKFQYTFKTGTSQAAPHVAGAIALLLSRNKGLTYQEVRDILFDTTVPNYKLRSDAGVKCGGLGDTEPQNFKFGWGRLRLPDPNDTTVLPREPNPPNSNYWDEEPPTPTPSLVSKDCVCSSTPPSQGCPGMVEVAMMWLISIVDRLIR